MKNAFLIGNKVYLRPLEREDARLIVPWFNDPEVTRTIRRNHPMTLRAEEEYLDKIAQNENELALGIVVRATDQLVGATGLHQMDVKNRHANFGIMIGEKGEWGKGYGTEATQLMVRHAFETLNLNRVWLMVYEYNERGIRSYDRAGFKREGVLRQENFREGRYWDTFLMAILRDDWEASSGSR